MVSGPVGFLLPALGNIVLGIDDDAKLKAQIESLEENQQKQIKEELEEFYEKLATERNICAMEMYSVDALEIFFRSELTQDEFKDMDTCLCDYRRDGIELEGICYSDANVGVVIDTYIISTESIIINLVDPYEKQSVMELVDMINEVLMDISPLNEVKKILFY